LFAAWIDFGWRNKSAADLESFALPDANYFVGDAGIATSGPSLLVNCSAPFEGDLPMLESMMPKFFRQCLVKTAFLTPSLSRSASFLGR
jgi:hypothetical protein